VRTAATVFLIAESSVAILVVAIGIHQSIHKLLHIQLINRILYISQNCYEPVIPMCYPFSIVAKLAIPIKVTVYFDKMPDFAYFLNKKKRLSNLTVQGDTRMWLNGPTSSISVCQSAFGYSDDMLINFRRWELELGTRTRLVTRVAILKLATRYQDDFNLRPEAWRFATCTSVHFINSSKTDLLRECVEILLHRQSTKSSTSLSLSLREDKNYLTMSLSS